MARTVYFNARLLDPATGLDALGSLVVEDGRIAALGTDTPVPDDAERVDCSGLCIAPGLVDMRVQVGEPGEEHKETLTTAARAAAAGGVTSIAVLPNTHPPVDDVAGVEFMRRRSGELPVRFHPYAAATKGLNGRDLAEMGLLSEAGAVAFTDGTAAIADAQVMRRVLAYARTYDLLVVQHPEEPRLAEGGMMNGGEIATRLGLAGIPAEAEVMMVERDLRLVEMTGARYHVAHVSTWQALDAIRAAKARGLPVTCDTAPPYFALNETAVGDYRTFAKFSPPLRTEYDRRAVADAIADGTIDAVASDHSPHDQDAKRVPFAIAAFGAVGLETLLPLMLELVQNGQLKLLQALRLLTSAPADILRIPAGRLAIGAQADLALFDPDELWRIDTAQFAGKSRNTPFDGRPVTGRVRRTVLGGRTVYSRES